VIPPEAMTILATIGLTQDQAVQVARALSMVEAATFEDSINRAKAQIALDEIEESKTLRRERNARYYDLRRSKRLEPSNGVLSASNSASRARVLCGAEEVDINPRMTTSSTPKGAGRGSRLPEDWSPSEAHKAEAVRLGLSAEDLAKIAEEFRNFWLSEAGQRARKIDWDRTFLNRLRDQAPRYLKKREVNSNGYQSNGAKLRAAFEKLDERLRPFDSREVRQSNAGLLSLVGPHRS
jgi:hypothetical protein